jgi:hypothetical protein
MSDFKANYLELESWKKWYFSIVLDIPPAYKGSVGKNKNKVYYDDDIAVEVLNFRKNLKNFAGIALVLDIKISLIFY